MMSKTEKELTIITDDELKLASGGKIYSKLPTDVNPNETIFVRLIQIMDENNNPLLEEKPGPWIKYNGPETLAEISQKLATGRYKVEYIIY